MAKQTVGLVFHLEPDQIQPAIDLLENSFDTRVLVVKVSWGKLWIKEA